MLSKLTAPAYKITFTDGRVETHQSTMATHLAVERRWPLAAQIDESSGRPTIQPRPEAEMRLFAAHHASKSSVEFDEWCALVVQVREVEPEPDPDPTRPGPSDD